MSDARAWLLCVLIPALWLLLVFAGQHAMCAIHPTDSAPSYCEEAR